MAVVWSGRRCVGFVVINLLMTLGRLQMSWDAASTDAVDGLVVGNAQPAPSPGPDDLLSRGAGHWNRVEELEF